MSDFEVEWARCSGWLEAALVYARGTHLVEDVKAAVLSGEAKFWPGKRSAVITEVRAYPRLRELAVWLAGGDLDELLDHLLPAIEREAKLQRCHRLVVVGRPGWVRAMEKHGYTGRWACTAKEFV